jgi:hypothetical protein
MTRKAGQTKAEPDLRGRNSLYLWSFMAVNVTVFLCVIVERAFPQSLQSIGQFWSQVKAKDGIIAASVPIAVIVLSGVLSDNVKARLVFWRWRDPLPGCRAFTNLLEQDPRIDVKVLTSKHGRFPKTPFAQNALWYRFYREHKLKPMVWYAHRVYLLTRELTAVSACLAVVLPLGAAVAQIDWRTLAYYALALIAQYAIIATAARNYGHRFVLDVLSEECTSCRAAQA